MTTFQRGTYIRLNVQHHDHHLTCTRRSFHSRLPLTCAAWIETYCLLYSDYPSSFPTTSGPFCPSPYVKTTSALTTGSPNFSTCQSQCATRFPASELHACLPCFCPPGTTSISISSTDSGCSPCPLLPVASGLPGCPCTSFGGGGYFLPATSVVDGPCQCVSGTLTCSASVSGTYQPIAGVQPLPLCQCVGGGPNSNPPINQLSTASMSPHNGLSVGALVCR